METMGEDLSINSILTAEQIDNLFVDVPENEPEEEAPKQEEEIKEEKEKPTTEVNPDTLFEEPESVGSGEVDNEVQEDTTPDKNSASPNFYSSIAKALKDDSVFTDLEPEKITSAEDFADMIE